MVEIFEKYPLLTFFGHKNKDIAYFFGRIRKKSAQTHFILIIYSKVLSKD
jgi:hypothetical protein